MTSTTEPRGAMKQDGRNSLQNLLVRFADVLLLFYKLFLHQTMTRMTHLGFYLGFC